MTLYKNSSFTSTASIDLSASPVACRCCKRSSVHLDYCNNLPCGVRYVPMRSCRLSRIRQHVLRLEPLQVVRSHYLSDVSTLLGSRWATNHFRARNHDLQVLHSLAPRYAWMTYVFPFRLSSGSLPLQPVKNRTLVVRCRVYQDHLWPARFCRVRLTT